MSISLRCVPAVSIYMDRSRMEQELPWFQMTRDLRLEIQKRQCDFLIGMTWRGVGLY